MSPNLSKPILKQTGFSLVELMVGMVIGLLATLVIIQVMSTFETQKRATTGSADSQTNGNIAMLTIERELNLAGFPLMPVVNSPLKCTATTINGVAETPANRNSLLISPVIITDGAANTPDTITVRYGNSLAGGVPMSISAAALGQSAVVASSFGCRINDTALISDLAGNNCFMSNVTGVEIGNLASAIPATVGLQNTTGATAAGNNLACLGAWNVMTYSIAAGNLQKSESTPYGNPPISNVAVPLISGIVDLQAQYGITNIPANQSAQNNQVTQWVDATGIWAANAITVANRNRIKAIRIVLVARNAKKENEIVTNNPLIPWVGTISSPAPTIDLSADADWQKYRYRLYETIIPLRNVIWSKGKL